MFARVRRAMARGRSSGPQLERGIEAGQLMCPSRGLVDVELGDSEGLVRETLSNVRHILAELRRSGIVGSQRGADGGYRLQKAATEVSVADVIRAVEGPLADVHGTPPEALDPPGVAAPVKEVWLATRAAMRSVLEVVTVADIAGNDLPPVVGELLADPGAWSRR